MATRANILFFIAASVFHFGFGWSEPVACVAAIILTAISYLVDKIYESS